MTYGEMVRRIEATANDAIPAVAAELLAHLEAVGQTPDVARESLGYLLGYCDRPTAEAWYAALPDVAHPAFGPTFGRGWWPTPEEALATGMAWAQRRGRP